MTIANRMVWRGMAVLFVGMVSCVDVIIGVRSAFADSIIIDFSDKSLGTNSYYNGGPTTNTLGWSSGGALFGNGYNSSWGSWNGFAYSNVNAPTTPGWENEYAAVTGTGYGGSGIYAVAYSGSQDFINLPANYRPASVQVTNTAYAYYDMVNGSGFSKKFGGVSGADTDWLRLTFTGYEGPGATGAQTGITVDFYLADYRFANSAQDYIVNAWQQIDLSPLADASSIGLSWSSSDVGAFGINTPTYVAIDNLTITAVPEPATAVLLACGGAVAWVVRRRTRAA